MRFAFRAEWADCDADTATGTGYDDAYPVWVTCAEGWDPEAQEERGTVVVFSQTVFPGPGRGRYPWGKRNVRVRYRHGDALALDGRLDVRRCRLTRGRLSVDFEPRPEDPVPVEGADAQFEVEGIEVELGVDEERWDWLGSGLARLFLESPEILDLPERFQKRGRAAPSEGEEPHGEGATNEDDVPF